LRDLFSFGAGAGAALAPDPLARLLPIMEARGVKVSPPAFHSAVKIAFFSSGAESYDEVSSNLWQSLPEQLQRLASDYLSQHAPMSARMTALDVGCGTGLTSELLLQTRFGAFVRQLDLLDPSQEMLDVCGARETLRNIRHRPIRGTIQDLPPRSHYDLIVAGCVLQHIPDRPGFLHQIALRQRPGGIFIHVQDPNGDYVNDFERLERVERLARSLRVRPSTLLKRLSAARPWRRKGETHTDRVNRELLAQKVIAEKMTDAEIRLVVDLPAHDGRGVSMREMETLLPDYRLVSCRSYAFFGDLISDLPPAYRKLEQALAAQRSMNGSQVAAIWMKTLRPKT
jgi:trans-aconitate methyltransferase